MGVLRETASVDSAGKAAAPPARPSLRPFALALVAVISGCVATAAAPPSRGVVVTGPPPAPVAEVRTAPPTENAVWLDGYWHWTGGRYAWIPGHWETAPPGAQWYGPRYVTVDGTTTYEPGTWRKANALR